MRTSLPPSNYEAESKEVEAARLRAQESAEIDEFGASGRLLDIARVVAAEAEQKLGRMRAQTLLKDTYNAPYGRGGRQNDIKAALGETVPEMVERFYNFSRARDFDAVLGAALRILERSTVQSNTQSSQELATTSLDAPTLEPGLAPGPEKPAVEMARPISQLTVDKKGWWSHELPDGSKHSGKLSKPDKADYDAGQRIEIACELCPDHPVVGYAKK